MSRDKILHIFHKKNAALVRKKLTLPNGLTVELDVVRHPGAVLIVPFKSKNEVLLLRQFRPSLEKYLYEFPAGTINPGENPFHCAMREIREETGFAATRMVKVGKIHPVPGYSTELITIYRAEGLLPRPAPGDADEVITVKVVSRGKFKEMVREGAITDAKTICGAVFCGLFS